MAEVPSLEPLTPVGDGIWTVARPLRFLGVEIGTRMTVVRLPEASGGGLWIHSPVEPDAALLRGLEPLGPVRQIVAPNRFHHLYAGRWLEHHPEARLLLAPGLAAKRPDLAERPGAAELGDAPDPTWGDVLEAVPVRGMSLLNEVAFLHRPSRSLVQCDLAFHVGSGDPPWTRWTFWCMGAHGRLATTPLERLVTRDRAAARASLERVLAWDFDRVLVAHGRPQETDGRRAFREAWRWLLGPGREARNAPV